MFVNAKSEVLADHADTRARPTLKLVIVDEIPFLDALSKEYGSIKPRGAYCQRMGLIQKCLC
jgi:hypothetical protein